MIDMQLEAQIDLVGRERVFARAEQLGWRRSAGIPKWVWLNIVTALRRECGMVADLTAEDWRCSAGANSRALTSQERG